MGNIASFCCNDSPSESNVRDEREEQSRIWSEHSSNCQQYGTCLPPNPASIYKIVLPKLIPVDIDCIHSQINENSISSNTSRALGASSSLTSTPDTLTDKLETSEDIDNDLIVTDELIPPKSPQPQNKPAVIKEEYCAEQFNNLRSLIFISPEAQNQFKELLWSCIPWSAPGGKSGSTFLKTINDQFILKEMSKLELQSFLSIAIDYFKYVIESYQESKPSLLSTILGIYRIVYTNSATQSSSEYYFMVMRNLFYKRKISQRFDLKGSMRNRLVNTDDPDNTQHVLMDENLLRITCEHPLLIHARSKQILNEAIDNDSRFLTSISVMDYSLLVGVDKEHQELVLGIIDYVRPFTWDKKIERVVKSVVGTELPTIIEPELYRERFCEAMDKYFESAPDNW